MHKVYLKPGKEDSLKRFHPWIFSGAIARFDGEPDEGEVVEVYTSKKEFIAEGHFQIGSIAVRVLSFRQEPIDHDFWKRKLEIAYDMRRSIGIATNPTNNTYRLVHGEGDNLPGLVIDIYAKTAVMQAHSAGMHVDRMTIAEALSEVMGDKIENIYYKSETTLPFKADLFPENGFLKGGSSDNIAQEYGLKFHVDWLKGQKTGFFLDQKYNRLAIQRICKDAKVLDCFTHTGSFALNAGIAGASSISYSVSADSLGDFKVSSTVGGALAGAGAGVLKKIPVLGKMMGGGAAAGEAAGGAAAGAGTAAEKAAGASKLANFGKGILKKIPLIGGLFPAPAGMNRLKLDAHSEQITVPRASGDEPTAYRAIW